MVIFRPDSQFLSIFGMTTSVAGPFISHGQASVISLGTPKVNGGRQAPLKFPVHHLQFAQSHVSKKSDLKSEYA